jgi:hypothetical protein
MLSDAMLLGSRRSSRASSPNDISMDGTSQGLAAAPLQEDGSQATTDDWVMPEAPPITTLTMKTQQAENTCMNEHLPDLEQDIDMDWDEVPVTTLNKDDPAAPSQASSDHAPPTPAFTVDADNNVAITSGPISSAAVLLRRNRYGSRRPTG